MFIVWCLYWGGWWLLALQIVDLHCDYLSVKRSEFDSWRVERSDSLQFSNEFYLLLLLSLSLLWMILSVPYLCNFKCSLHEHILSKLQMCVLFENILYCLHMLKPDVHTLLKILEQQKKTRSNNENTKVLHWDRPNAILISKFQKSCSPYWVSYLSMLPYDCRTKHSM